MAIGSLSARIELYLSDDATIAAPLATVKVGFPVPAVWVGTPLTSWTYGLPSDTTFPHDEHLPRGEQLGFTP